MLEMPGFTDAKSAYHFDVQCKHESKWVTVYKYPHVDPCASREKCATTNMLGDSARRKEGAERQHLEGRRVTISSDLGEEDDEFDEALSQSRIKKGVKTKGCKCKKYKPLTHKDFFRMKPGWKMLSFSQGTECRVQGSMAGNPKFLKKHPNKCSPPDSKLAVRCCQDGNDKVKMTKYGCNKDKTYAEAGAICRNKGYRLCSADEMKAGKTAGTGCGYDAQRVWTSASSPPSPWRTTVSKCPGPSAEWRVANMRPHPDLTQTGHLEELTTAEIVFAGDGQPQSIPSALPPLGGPCGVHISRAGNTDVVTWGKCKEPVANAMITCAGSAPYAEVGSTVDCRMAVDKDPGTFTAFRHHGSIQYRNSKPQKIQQVWMYMHSAHRPSAQVDKFVFRCGDAPQQFSSAPSTKGWKSFKLKEPCNASAMSLEKLESKNSRSNPRLPTIVVAEVRLTKADFAKADLPLPRNNKIQKSWCVRSQTVPLGAHKNFGRAHTGMGEQRLVTSFKPKLDGIPCGSRIIMRPLFHLKGGSVGTWGESWLFFEMWDNSKRLWKNYIRGVQKSKGKWRYFHAPFGGTLGRMARPAGGKVQLIARTRFSGNRLKRIHIDKTIMLDWWYKTPDPDTPCAN